MYKRLLPRHNGWDRLEFACFFSGILPSHKRCSVIFECYLFSTLTARKITVRSAILSLGIMFYKYTIRPFELPDGLVWWFTLVFVLCLSQDIKELFRK